jgi:hypothetical protein
MKDEKTVYILFGFVALMFALFVTETYSVVTHRAGCVEHWASQACSGSMGVTR